MGDIIFENFAVPVEKVQDVPVEITIKQRQSGKQNDIQDEPYEKVYPVYFFLISNCIF